MAIDSELILTWRREYGSVYQVKVKDKQYVFRPIVYAEYDEALLLSKYTNTAQQEDYIVTTALLYPDISVDDMMPGLVSKLATAILDNSGFGSPQRAKEILEEHRSKAASVRTTVYALVLDALPNYTKENLDQYDFAKLVDLAIIAEEIIRIRQAYAQSGAEVTFDIIDLEEQRKEEEEKARRRAEGQRRSAEMLGHDPKDVRYAPTVKGDDPIAQRLAAALGKV